MLSKEDKELVKNALDEVHATVKARVSALDERERKLEAREGRERLAGIFGRGYERSGERPITMGNAERKAFEKFARTGDPTEWKSMLENTDPSGGYTVSPQLSSDIQRLAANFSPMRQLAKVVQANSPDYRQVVAAGFMGAEWRTESATRAETDTSPFATVHPMHGEISSVVPITRWLLEDSSYDLANFITEETGRAHGVAEGAAFISGNGVNRPSGLLVQPTADTDDDTRPFGTLQTFPSGTSGSVAGASGSQADPLIDLFHKLKPAYRANASWLVSTEALAQMRKLKDTVGSLLWQPSLTPGQASTFLGRPVFEDPNMPDCASGSLSVAVGDFSRGYLIVDIGRPVLIRDDVTVKGKVLFEVARRVGGAVLDTNAIKLMRLATS